MSRIVGVGCAVKMMLTARRVGSEQGQTFGLPHHMAYGGKAIETGMEFAQRIAKKPPLANATIINAVPRIADMSIADGMSAESMATAMTQVSDEAQARIRGFLDKQTKK